jgi:hypothetical protein
MHRMCSILATDSIELSSIYRRIPRLVCMSSETTRKTPATASAHSTVLFTVGGMMGGGRSVDVTCKFHP